MLRSASLQLARLVALGSPVAKLTQLSSCNWVVHVLTWPELAQDILSEQLAQDGDAEETARWFVHVNFLNLLAQHQVPGGAPVNNHRIIAQVSDLQSAEVNRDCAFHEA